MTIKVKPMSKEWLVKNNIQETKLGWIDAPYWRLRKELDDDTRESGISNETRYYVHN